MDKDLWLTHAGLKNPKCPHCDHDYDIDEHEAWRLYDPTEDSHEIECPSCDRVYVVQVRVEYNFSTDDQSELSDG